MIAFAPAGLSYVGQLSRPRSVLFRQFLNVNVSDSRNPGNPRSGR